MRLTQFLATALAATLLGLTTTAGAADTAGTVLITGANRGIGLELARQFAGKGYKVIATARNVADAKDLNALAAANPSIVVEKLDVTDHAAVDALAAKYKDQPVDILLSNAAITPRLQTAYTGKVEKLDFAVARQSYETNALAPMKLAAAFMPHVAASKGKKIVFISSKGGSFGEGPALPIMFEYRASKAALNMLAHTLSYETKPKGIVTVMLSPGTVSTEPAPNEFGYGMKIRQPNAISPEESVKGLIRVIESATMAQNGLFLDHKDGRPVAF